MAMKQDGISGITLSHDAADAITVANLKDMRKYIKKALKSHKKGEQYMHPEDVADNTNRVRAIDVLLDYMT